MFVEQLDSDHAFNQQLQDRLSSNCQDTLNGAGLVVILPELPVLPTFSGASLRRQGSRGLKCCSYFSSPVRGHATAELFSFGWDVGDAALSVCVCVCGLMHIS
jgi:hypothetical protein